MTGSLACPDAPHYFRESNAGVYLNQSRLEQERIKGYWPGHVLTDFFDASLAEHPNDLCLLTYRADIDAETSFTYTCLNDRVSRIAAGFAQLGVSRGDMISFQLPNWWEFIAVHLACIRLGVISNPLMPIFRARELEFMVDRAESRLLITPGSFRKFDHEAMAKSLRDKLPALEHTLIVGG